jgi:glycosyltransferase involved in cell wall biosynthesis
MPLQSIRPTDRRSRTCVLFVVYEKSWLGNDTIFSKLGKCFPIRALPVRKRSPTNKVHVPGKALLTLEELRNLLRLVWARDLYMGSWILVASAGHYSTLFFGRLLKLLRRDQKIYLYNFYLHALGERRFVRSILRFLLNQDVRIMAQSLDELEYFRELSKAIDIRYTPYCQDPLDVDAGAELGTYVFAGGHTNRDFNSLLRCAERSPDLEFVIVASSRSKITEPTPPNATLFFDLEQADFYRLMAHSRLVVVPLFENVGSSGQMVTLAAMQFGKTLVVPDFAVVQQYVEADITGFVYEHGDEHSLCEIIRAAWGDEDRLRAVGLAAQRRYQEHFRRRRFDEAVVNHILDGDGQQVHGAPGALNR